MTKKNLSLFDSRIYKRNIAQGLITQEEYDQYIKSLPDDTDASTTVDLEAILEDEIFLPSFPALEIVENIE